MVRRWKKRVVNSDKKDRRGSGYFMKDKQKRLINLTKSQLGSDLVR